jgi:hypothetical protein
MKTLILISVLALFGCQDRYRYPCQNPLNHTSPACQPPACEASGTCTKYLVQGENNEE